MEIGAIQRKIESVLKYIPIRTKEEFNCIFGCLIHCQRYIAFFCDIEEEQQETIITNLMLVVQDYSFRKAWQIIELILKNQEIVLQTFKPDADNRVSHTVHSIKMLKAKLDLEHRREDVFNELLSGLIHNEVRILSLVQQPNWSNNTEDMALLEDEIEAINYFNKVECDKEEKLFIPLVVNVQQHFKYKPYTIII